MRLLVCFLALGLGAAEPAVDGWSIDDQLRAIFTKRCVECHGEQLRKPKGRFGYVLDLPRLARNEDLVVPGRANDSELYLLLVTDDPDELMPPPDSEHSGVMTTDEIELVHHWIDRLGQGHVPKEATTSPLTAAPTAAPPPAAGTGPPTLALLHYLILHFPIALLIVLVPSELWTLASGCIPQRRVDRFLLWTGSLATIGALITGLSLADASGYADDTIANHWLAGVVTLVLVLTATACHELQVWTGRRWLHIVEVILVLALAAAVFAAGHSGGELVHDHTLF